MFRLIAAASVASVALVGAALANGDGEKCFDKSTLSYVECPKEEAAPPPVTVIDWSGGYIGLHGGYAFVDFGVYRPRDLDPSGPLVGAQAGYLHQFDNNFVLGVEVDGSMVFAEDELALRDQGEVFATVGVDLDWLASARLRAGYAADELMPYLTGGVALAGYEVSASVGPFSAVGSGVLAGAVAGGGLEYMVDDNWRIRAEGLYYIFDDEVVDNTNFGLDDVIVGRVGASYRF